MDNGKFVDAAQILRNVYGALNELEVKGKQNHAIVVACMNDIEKVIKSLDEKEAADGNEHAES